MTLGAVLLTMGLALLVLRISQEHLLGRYLENWTSSHIYILVDWVGVPTMIYCGALMLMGKWSSSCTGVIVPLVASQPIFQLPLSYLVANVVWNVSIFDGIDAALVLLSVGFWVWMSIPISKYPDDSFPEFGVCRVLGGSICALGLVVASITSVIIGLNESLDMRRYRDMGISGYEYGSFSAENLHGSYSGTYYPLATIAAVLMFVGWSFLRGRKGWSFYLVAPVAGVMALAAAFGIEGQFVRLVVGPYPGPTLQLVNAAIVPVLYVVVFAWISAALDRHFKNRPRRDAVARGSFAPVLIGYGLSGEPIYGQPAAVASSRTNTFAIVALVCGFVSGILAIPFGHIALSQIKRTGEQGRGMAIAGLVLGYLSLVAYIGLIIWFAVVWNSIDSYY